MASGLLWLLLGPGGPPPVFENTETTRLFGRGIANIEPQWIEEVAGHLLRKHRIRIFSTASNLETMRFEPSIYLSDEELAQVDAGFRDVAWHAPQLAPGAEAGVAPGYWDAFIRQPPPIEPGTPDRNSSPAIPPSSAPRESRSRSNGCRTVRWAGSRQSSTKRRSWPCSKPCPIRRSPSSRWSISALSAR